MTFRDVAMPFRQIDLFWLGQICLDSRAHEVERPEMRSPDGLPCIPQRKAKQSSPPRARRRSKRITPCVRRISCRPQIGIMLRHHRGEKGSLAETSGHIAVHFRNAPAFRCGMKIKSHHASRRWSQRFVATENILQGARQSRTSRASPALPQFLFRHDCLGGEIFRFRCESFPIAPLHHERK